MSKSEDFNPVIIIGAARSGTNMLRDILTAVPDFGTWDCDEINPIWRHGNLSHPSDEFNADMATDSIKRFIRRKFSKIGKALGVSNVVEKSCANSLRVSFINEILPEAKYVFIYRDGRDTVASSAIRYNASFELGYTLKKLRYVPVMDIPYYGMRFGWNRVKQMMGSKQLSFWGVQLNDMQEKLQKYSLFEVCALQWKECVEKSLRDFKNVPDERVYRIAYEKFVLNPEEELKKILDFLNVDSSGLDVSALVGKVSAKSIGKYKTQLTDEEQQKINALLQDTLEELGYE